MNPQGAIAAMKAYREAKKGNTVDQQTVRDRARICKGCPKRRIVANATTAVSKLLGRMANKHRVPDDVSRYSCGVCGCSLMLLLPAQKEHLHKDSPEEAAERPEHCWVPKA